MLASAREALLLAKQLQAEAPKTFLPPSDGTKPETQQVLPHALVKGTRGYIERVCFQVNGAYEQGWFDACAVMMRRLVETLIIETFEHHKIDHKIKNPGTGDFLMLRDLIDKALQEPTWNLGRNTKQALPRLKTLGDQSAHSRRYNAHREDIDRVIQDFRGACQELIYLANLK
ncbi:MAG: DUF4145 domain-containing protein [Betaproteobacteria bacterium]|nr:DUF4145 domain-containing protein [Betaproteobacteria bacterium]